MATLTLPVSDGRLETYSVGSASPFPSVHRGVFPRTVYAAAHVVADARELVDPWRSPSIDWDATMAFRRHLWGLGFKIAEAMDTSQRGMGLDWTTAAELIERANREAKAVPGADLASGAGTDQLDPARSYTLAEVTAAYEVQVGHIEACGGRAILMASRALCRSARSRDDYLAVYDRLITNARDKVILHWLGPMFDPELAGYWGSTNIETAMDTCLDLIETHSSKVDGIKISLLEKSHEERMRIRLPNGVKMFTGDDFNYVDLIEGDGRHVSHGLLGIFDPIAPAAAVALDKLANGDVNGYRSILDPTVALSRRIFEAPTYFYKAGVVFMAWLNGFQDHFRMVGGMESARGILHYADVFRLADRAQLLIDPEKAVHRMKKLCAINGIE